MDKYEDGRGKVVFVSSGSGSSADTGTTKLAGMDREPSVTINNHGTTFSADSRTPWGGDGSYANTETTQPADIDRGPSAIINSHGTTFSADSRTARVGNKETAKSSAEKTSSQPKTTTVPPHQVYNTSSGPIDPGIRFDPDQPPEHYPPLGPIRPEELIKYFNLASEVDYLMVSVAPVLLATFLPIPLQVLITSLNSILPFRALRHPQGATSAVPLGQSRNPSVSVAPFIAARYLKHFRDPLPLLGTLLGGLATLVVSLSTELIKLEGSGDCSRKSMYPPDEAGSRVTKRAPLRSCAFGLRKSSAVVWAVEALLVVLAVLVVSITVILARWRSGIAADPWSIASMASMIPPDGELDNLLRTLPTPRHPGDQTSRNMATHVQQVLDGKPFSSWIFSSSAARLVLLLVQSHQQQQRHPPTTTILRHPNRPNTHRRHPPHPPHHPRSPPAQTHHPIPQHILIHMVPHRPRPRHPLHPRPAHPHPALRDHHQPGYLLRALHEQPDRGRAHPLRRLRHGHRRLLELLFRLRA